MTVVKKKRGKRQDGKEKKGVEGEAAAKDPVDHPDRKGEKRQIKKTVGRLERPKIGSEDPDKRGEEVALDRAHIFLLVEINGETHSLRNVPGHLEQHEPVIQGRNDKNRGGPKENEKCRPQKNDRRLFFHGRAPKRPRRKSKIPASEARHWPVIFERRR